MGHTSRLSSKAFMVLHLVVYTTQGASCLPYFMSPRSWSDPEIDLVHHSEGSLISCLLDLFTVEL